MSDTPWVVDWLDALAAGESETERTRRALLSAAEDVSHSGAWAWRVGDDHVLWSPGMFRLWEIEPMDRVPLSLIEQHMHPGDRHHRAERLQAVRAGERREELIFRVLLPGGRVRFLVSVAAERFEADATEIVVGSIRDLAASRRPVESEIACHIAVTSVLSSWEGPQAGIERLLSALSAALGFTRASFWVRDGERLTPIARVRADARTTGVAGDQLRAGLGLVGMAFAQREPVWSQSLGASTEYPFQDAALRARVQGAVAFPIIRGDEVLAAIGMGGSEDFELTERLSVTLTGIGHELGSFLANHAAGVRPSVLTPREIEILRLASEGLSGPAIARRLFVSPTTVKTHFENIYVKYEVSDRVAAVARAMREGLLT